MGLPREEIIRLDRLIRKPPNDDNLVYINMVAYHHIPFAMQKIAKYNENRDRNLAAAIYRHLNELGYSYVAERGAWKCTMPFEHCIADTALMQAHGALAEYFDCPRLYSMELAYYYFNKAANETIPYGKENAELSVKIAKAHVESIKRSHPDIEERAEEFAKAFEAGSSPDEARKLSIKIYNGSIDSPDISYILNPAEGTLRERLSRAHNAIDGELHQYDRRIRALSIRMQNICDQQIDAANTRADLKTDAILAASTKRQLTVLKTLLVHDNAAISNRSERQALTGAVAFALTGNPLTLAGPLASAAFPEKNALTGPITALARANNIEISAIQDSVALLESNLAQWATQAQEAEGAHRQHRRDRLLSAILKKEMVQEGLAHIDALEATVQKYGYGDADTFIEAISDSGIFDKETTENLVTSLRNLCYGFADSNEVELILSAANNMHGESGNLEKALHAFSESEIKRNIDEYLSAASRIDALKQEGFNFIENPNDALKNGDYKRPILVESLIANSYSTVGSQEITRLFDFYLHRHGKTHLQHTAARGSKLPKTVDIADDSSLEAYEEDLRAASKRGDTSLPDIPSLFQRICAEEYIKSFNMHHARPIADFKDRPEIPAAYMMVNDVISTFTQKMSLSPIAKYRETLQGRNLVDNIIAQTFIDFFAHTGVAHYSAFGSEMRELAEAYGSHRYMTRMQSTHRAISADASKQYDIFRDLLEQNFNKALLISKIPQAQAILKDIEELHDQGIALTTPNRIIIPTSSEAVDHALHTRKLFANMPPTKHTRAH